jgi:hypothetical protein
VRTLPHEVVGAIPLATEVHLHVLIGGDEYIFTFTDYADLGKIVGVHPKLKALISLIDLIKLMSSTERFTTVPVKSSTLHALQAYRVGGKSYDDIIWDFIEANPPASFWKEIERRSKEPDLTLAQVRRSLGL